MSFLTKLQKKISPIKSTFKIGDFVHQEGEGQTMIVKDFHRAPHSKLPLVECEWYDAKDMTLRRNTFAEEALVRRE